MLTFLAAKSQTEASQSSSDAAASSTLQNIQSHNGPAQSNESDVSGGPAKEKTEKERRTPFSRSSPGRGSASGSDLIRQLVQLRDSAIQNEKVADSLLLLVAKERAKADKVAKFAAKQAKKSAPNGAPAGPGKKKEKPKDKEEELPKYVEDTPCLLYTSPSPRDGLLSRMPSSA